VGFSRSCAPVPLRAPVFLSSLPRKTGRCAPPPPRPSQLRCFSVDPQKSIKSIELGPPMVASLILPAIFCGQNYVPMRPVFSFLYSSLIFSFCYSLLFSSLLFISFLSIFSYPSLLILLVGTILRLLILLFLYFRLFVVLHCYKD
jgi:hypothetical protein